MARAQAREDETGDQPVRATRHAPRATILIDSAGDRYYLGGVAAKRGVGRPVDPNHLLARPVFGASAVQRLLPPRRRPRGRRLSRILHRILRGRGSLVPPPPGRLAHRLRTGRAPLAPRLRLLRPFIGRSAGTAGAQRRARLLAADLPNRALLRALPLHVAVLAAKAWRRSREGQLLPFLRGKLGVLGEASDLLRHRRRLRSSWLRPRLGRLGRRAAFLGMKSAARSLFPPLSVASPHQADSS